MSIYIFADTGYSGNVMAVEADSEMEARGILQKESISGINPTYRGTLNEIMGDDSYAHISSSSAYK